jgi:putative acetyltransferase
VNLTIRPEGPEDAAGIRALLTIAFPTGAEADLVEQLRRDGDIEITLVAEDDGRIVGHIVMSRMQAKGDGRSFRTLGLAPLAVLPKRQHGGIASRLIREALAIARSKGEELVFVLGAPAYYGRFGFSAAIAAPFASPLAGPHLMALSLVELDLPSLGKADYAPAFAVFE